MLLFVFHDPKEGPAVDRYHMRSAHTIPVSNVLSEHPSVRKSAFPVPVLSDKDRLIPGKMQSVCPLCHNGFLSLKDILLHPAVRQMPLFETKRHFLNVQSLSGFHGIDEYISSSKSEIPARG